MFTKLEIGKLLKDGVTKYNEGNIFDINDCGCNLIIRFRNPSNNELDSIKSGKIKVGYYINGEAIFMLFKFEGLQWMDAPYSVHLSKCLTTIQDINDGQELALNIYLVDANTGILQVMRLVGLPTIFSRKLKSEIEKQCSTSFKSYYQTIQTVYMKYPTNKLVDYADLICNV